MKYFPFFALTWTSQHVICFRPYLLYPNRSILGNFDYKLIKVNSLVTNSDHFSHIVKFFSQKYRDYYLILFNIFPCPFLSVIFKHTWKSQEGEIQFQSILNMKLFIEIKAILPKSILKKTMFVRLRIKLKLMLTNIITLLHTWVISLNQYWQ